MDQGSAADTRKKLIVAVWKEKLTFRQSSRAAGAVAEGVLARPQWPFAIAIAPSPFSYVAVRQILTGSPVATAAQNVLWDADQGSYIGEVTARMLREVGCDYVMVGHSERRIHFHEDDDVVARKVLTVVKNQIVPIVCFGDTHEERQAGKTQEVIRRQLGACFDRLGDLLTPANIILAYEPVWAISTWRSDQALPRGEEVSGLHQYIRDVLADLAGSEFATAVSLLYGGSVAPDNVRDYMSFADVDGALVGGASKSPASFLALLAEADEGIKLCGGAVSSRFPDRT